MDKHGKCINMLLCPYEVFNIRTRVQAMFKAQTPRANLNAFRNESQARGGCEGEQGVGVSH